MEEKGLPIFITPDNNQMIYDLKRKSEDNSDVLARISSCETKVDIILDKVNFLIEKVDSLEKKISPVEYSQKGNEEKKVEKKTMRKKKKSEKD
jgi:hypothetical protein